MRKRVTRRSRAFDVDDFVHGRGDIVDGTLAARLDHQLVSLRKQTLHQRNQLTLLQQRFAAGELDEFDGGELFDLGDNLVFA